jgi:flagellar FliL protein
MLGNKKLIIVIVLVVTLIIGLVVAAFLLVPSLAGGDAMQIQISLGGPAEGAAAAPHTETPAMPVAPPEEAHGGEHLQGLLYDLGSKVVNLADPDGLRYLKAGVVVEILPMDPKFYALSGEERHVEEEKIREELNKYRAVMEDVITTKLSDKTFEEVFTVAGKEQLKQELRDDMNARLTEWQVRDIYFTEFVIQ